jgi:hypothetical protein
MSDEDAMPLKYQHSARPFGYPISFKLDGDRLFVDNGRKLQEVRLGAVEEVRLTYEAKSFAQRVFKTRVRMKDGKTFAFSSINWKSLIEAERKEREYRDFGLALFEAIQQANPEARFVAGRPYWMWVASTMLAFVSMVVIAFFIWRALQSGAMGAALMGVILGAAGYWQLEPMVRLNKPRTFTPNAPPDALMPAS